MPVRSVRNSSEAALRDGGRRWLNRARTVAWVGGIRRTRRPGEEKVNTHIDRMTRASACRKIILGY